MHRENELLASLATVAAILAPSVMYAASLVPYLGLPTGALVLARLIKQEVHKA